MKSKKLFLLCELNFIFKSKSNFQGGRNRWNSRDENNTQKKLDKEEGKIWVELFYFSIYGKGSQNIFFFSTESVSDLGKNLAAAAAVIVPDSSDGSAPENPYG